MAKSVASDSFDESVDVVISGSVDTNTQGEYEINYIAADTSGNASAVNRIVKVFAPVLDPRLQMFNVGSASVSGGDRFYALFSAIDIPVGTKIFYKLSGTGITSDDVEGELTGSVDVVALQDGPANPLSPSIPGGGPGAVISIPIIEDQLTEGQEAMQISFFTDESLETRYQHDVYGSSIEDASTTTISVEQRITRFVPSRDGGTISSLTLGCNSKAGTQYKIMYSEDLSNWEVLKNVQSIGETTEVSIDIQTDNFKSLFYKVRETFE